LPIERLMMTAMTVINRKIVHSIQNPIGSVVRKQGHSNQQVPTTFGWKALDNMALISEISSLTFCRMTPNRMTLNDVTKVEKVYSSGATMTTIRRISLIRTISLATLSIMIVNRMFVRWLTKWKVEHRTDYPLISDDGGQACYEDL
jgi:hypothetical protein